MFFQWDYKCISITQTLNEIKTDLIIHCKSSPFFIGCAIVQRGS